MAKRQVLRGRLSMPVLPSTEYQKKTVTPSGERQVIRADAGYAALLEVTVEPVPSGYGRIIYKGYTLIVE